MTMWCLACEDTQAKNAGLKTKLEYISRDRDALKAEITKLILRVKELEEEHKELLFEHQVALNCCDSAELFHALKDARGAK